MKGAPEEGKLSPLVSPSDVTVLWQVKSGKVDISDRGEDTPSKTKHSSHKSPKKTSKAVNSTDFKEDLKSLDDKWSEQFARLEAMFLAKSFTVSVEPVQKSDVVVTGRPFILLVQKSTGATGQMKATKPVEAPGASTATQPVEAPGALIATQPVEAPGVTTVMQPTGQDLNEQFASDRPEVQPSGPSSHTLPSVSGRSELQTPDPTGQPVAVKKNWVMSLTSTTALSDEPDSDGECFSDHASPVNVEEEGEV